MQQPELRANEWCLTIYKMSSTPATPEYIIHIEGLWKSYSTGAAVKDLSLHVPPRSVYGFLGPNGAGKSTTIRLMLGLQQPDKGSISLFGHPLKSNRIALLKQIGSLVESPSLYLHLTGRENLEVHRRLLNVPVRAIDEALDTVDLTAAANRIVRAYSSGMKQRLGIAQALLGSPQLLILDEPTNGLDPAGIHEMRTLVSGLPAQRGVTVFLSSHLLPEVEQVCQHYAIISEGQLRFEGDAKQLREHSKPLIEICVDNPQATTALLTRNQISFSLKDGVFLLTPDQGRGPGEINTMLVLAGIGVSNLTTRHATLEDTFLDLTGRTA